MVVNSSVGGANSYYNRWQLAIQSCERLCVLFLLLIKLLLFIWLLIGNSGIVLLLE